MEQTDDRDQLWIRLRPQERVLGGRGGIDPPSPGGPANLDLWTYLDEGAAVALAQLSLLREALLNDLAIRVRVPTDEYSEDKGMSKHRFVEVRLYRPGR